MPFRNENPYFYLRRKYGSPATRRLLSPEASTQVASLPIVVTVGVNSVTTTTANVVGSVNPQGLSTTWWVAYSTSLPITNGSVTTATAIGNGTSPITVTLNLTGLTTNATYYAAVVGQSSAGTVYGQPIAFTPQAQSPTTVAPALFGQPSVSIPHFNVPFSIVTTATQNGAVVVEQDTLEEILANVKTIALCGIGQCSQLSSFGIPSTTFQQGPLDSSEIVAAIQLWEPRASETVISHLNPDQSWTLSLETSYVAAQGA